MKSRTLTIGLVQISMESSLEENREKALKGVREAAKKGAHIVALPEIFTGPYFCQRKDDTKAFEYAEPMPNGPTTKAMAAVAKECKVTLVGGSVFEKASNGKFYNTTPVFGPDGALIGMYRKTHIPEDILYHEQHYFAPGDTGINVFDTPHGKICPLICYDQWYPEAARIATLKGAELIVYPTAIGLVDEEVEENITGDWETMWRSAMLGHAAVNNVFVAGVNRCGREDAINFWGGSFIADPSAKVLVKAGDKEGVFLAECDLARVKPIQATWNFLPNRRPDAYSDLLKKT